MTELSQFVIQLPKQKCLVLLGLSPGCLRHPHRADEQICVYPEYQPHTKGTLDISGMLKAYEEAIDSCPQSPITGVGHFTFKYTPAQKVLLW